jgi:hypothetical protein
MDVVLSTVRVLADTLRSATEQTMDTVAAAAKECSCDAMEAAV